MKMQTCPYCGNVLEKGTFRSRGSNYFLPADEKAPICYIQKAMDKKRAIMLPPDPLEVRLPNDISWSEAYVCRICKIIIVPYEQS